uniref:flagellar hook-associated protein FlgK n=1 Tax=Eubacterium cellulosolvens TaxID=29322 RepID=UPI000485C3EC|nr:flagellar basal body rod C-terminal domain-containing protein [[Eubacterium] cellulosolvens]
MIRATFAGFTTALSSLRANSKKLDVTGQNLANMTTEGYTRQEIKTSSLNYENPTSFYLNENDVNVGFGVSIDRMAQLRDQFLDTQYRTQNAKLGYNETISASLDALSGMLDETKQDGIHASFDKVQKALTEMQDPSKVNDPVYEGELRSRMQATANLFNQAALNIETSMKSEYANIDGAGSSENGYADKINQLLSQIGELNIDIKKNQMLGNPALELQDQRNLAIDELSKLIPIEVSYFTEKYETKDSSGTTVIRDHGLNYDSYGNPTGKSGFPEDLKIDLVYTKTDANGKNPMTERITLVNGSDTRLEDGTKVKNYGSVDIFVDGVKAYDEYGNRVANATYTGKRNATTGEVQQVQLRFNQADSYVVNTDSSGNPTTDSNMNAATGQTTGKSIMTDNHVEKDSSGNITDFSTVRLSGGSVQASLDMLCDSTSSLNNDSIYRSYDYYMNRLDILANTFALDMNRFNQMGVNDTYASGITLTDGTIVDGKLLTADQLTELSKGTYNTSTFTNKDFLLLVNSGASNAADAQTASNITAANISISKSWINGTTHIGTFGDPDEGNSSTDTALNMLQSMEATHAAIGYKSYSNEMNSISTYLANDAYNNENSLKSNEVILDGISTAKDQISGVSLDEEAANMMSYVTSYNAAARLMTTIDETLQTLLNIKS